MGADLRDAKEPGMGRHADKVSQGEITGSAKSLMLGKIEGRRMRWLDGITEAMRLNLGRLQEVVRNRTPSWAAVLGVANRHD